MSVGHLVHVLLIVYNSTEHVTQKSPGPKGGWVGSRASRARESSITHKSAITDHTVEENHVIDWDSVEVVANSDRPDGSKRLFGSGRPRHAWIGTQYPTNSATLGTRWFLGHVLHRVV